MIGILHESYNKNDITLNLFFLLLIFNICDKLTVVIILQSQDIYCIFLEKQPGITAL